MSITQPSKDTLKTMWHAFISGLVGRWAQKIILFTIFSFVVNHLASRESFPDGGSYRFPIEGFLFTIVLCILIGIIAELNFEFYKKKYFSKKVEIALNKIAGVETQFYDLLTGLLITLLLSFILIGLAYAQDIYNSYKLSIKDAEITIESGAKIKKLTYENIACFYSENKIVYTVQNDGTTITTDFTLNELEEKINDQLFFRANRQIIIHKDAVDQIEKIQNSKLSIRLKASIVNDAIGDITISRYKRKAFMAWLD